MRHILWFPRVRIKKWLDPELVNRSISILAYKIFFQSGLSKKHAIKEIKKSIPSSSEIDHLIDFLTSSERGICH